jgi:DNA-binding Lrp family transcriptional regulator
VRCDKKEAGAALPKFTRDPTLGLRLRSNWYGELITKREASILSMDEKDVKIFCEMGFKYYNYTGKNRRPSPKEIGAKLGLDEKTVWSRVRRMESEGFIQSYRAIPNPVLFGLPLLCTYGLRAPNVIAKRTATQKLREASGVLDIGDFLGETIGVTLVAASEEDATKRIKELSEQTGLPGMPFIPPRRFPTPTPTPNKLDWQLIKALRYNAIRPTSEVSEELTITHRTAEYRISRLLESQVLFVRAFINAKDPKGIILYSLYLELEEGAHEMAKRELLLKYKDRLWFEFSPPAPMLFMNLFATSIGEPEDELLETLSHPGVRSGSLTIIKGWIEPKAPSWIDRMVEDKIAAK